MQFSIKGLGCWIQTLIPPKVLSSPSFLYLNQQIILFWQLQSCSCLMKSASLFESSRHCFDIEQEAFWNASCGFYKVTHGINDLSDRRTCINLCIQVMSRLHDMNSRVSWNVFLYFGILITTCYLSKRWE